MARTKPKLTQSKDRDVRELGEDIEATIQEISSSAEARHIAARIVVGDGLADRQAVRERWVE